MKTALIFDLDGTLWDATIPVAESWDIVSRKYFGQDKVVSVDLVRSLMGKTMSEIAAALTPIHSDASIAKAFADECFAYENIYLADHPGVLFPHEIETLKDLSEEFDLYIVSNCQHGYIETFLPTVPKGLFKGHLCWSDTRDEKDVTIRKLMADYEISKAIYIGDTEKDELSTRKAGIAFIHAAYGFGHAKSPDGVARSFFELLQVARDLNKGLASE